MTGFAWWSLVALAALGITVRIGTMAYTKLKSPGSFIVGLALETWTILALIVWLRP
jgi:hypothetical protein